MRATCGADRRGLAFPGWTLAAGIAAVVLLMPLPLAVRAADEPAKRGPQAQEFYRIQSEMNTVLAELANLQVQFRTANEDKQATIKQQWDELMAKGKTLDPKLIAAAEKAYEEAPNADKGITDLLLRLLHHDVKNDDYEPAAVIGKLLMENKCPEKRVANLAGIAAFATNDFDAAKKYLEPGGEGRRLPGAGEG